MIWLRTHGWGFVFAVFLSFALWIYVSYQENPDRSTSFEGMVVQVQDMPVRLVIVDQDGMPRPDQTSLSTVNLSVRADQQTLTKLSQKHLNVFVELANLSPGDHQIPVNVELIRTDLRMKNFSAIDPDPEFVQVRLDQVITKTVPITLEVRGNLPASFERGDSQVTLQGKPITAVVVKGPLNRVERVASAQMEVNIDQLSTNFESTRDLKPLDANKEIVEGVTVNPAAVKVFIPIRSVVGLKRVPVLGHIEGVPASGYVVTQVRSDPPLITISGSSRWLDNISQVETEAVNILGATDVVSRRVSINLPPGVSLHRSEESEVLVKVQILPLLRPFQVQLPFTVKVTGNTRDLEETHDPHLLYIAVNGFTSSLAGVDEETLVATVDVQGLSPGTYTLTPDIVLPDGVTLAQDIPQVTVSLAMPPTPTPTPQPTAEDTPTSTPSATVYVTTTVTTPLPTAAITATFSPTAAATATTAVPSLAETPLLTETEDSEPVVPTVTDAITEPVPQPGTTPIPEPTSTPLDATVPEPTAILVPEPGTFPAPEPEGPPERPDGDEGTRPVPPDAPNDAEGEVNTSPVPPDVPDDAGGEEDTSPVPSDVPDDAGASGRSDAPFIDLSPVPLVPTQQADGSEHPPISTETPSPFRSFHTLSYDD